MSIMATEAPGDIDEHFVEDLYDRLHRHAEGRGESFTYVAREFEEQLLAALGYESHEQDRVTRAIKWLAACGRISRASVRTADGRTFTKRRDYPQPRRVEITILR